MSDAEHDDVVRASFTRQRALFEGPDSPFATRTPGPLTWIAPLQAEMRALEVACGPSHVHSFTEAELAELLPGGAAALTYADTTTFRFPVDVAITEQSDATKVMRLLRAEISGEAVLTGFEPEDEDGKVVVSFTTCVVHGRPR